MSKSKPTKAKGNRAAAYIRVSDESQIQGYSLDAQLAEIRRWCQKNGYEVVEVYADEGVSAHTDNIEKRPRLMLLLTDARNGKFDIVVVHNLDRWARNIGVQTFALAKLGEAKVGFTSATEDFDYSSPQGKFLLTMLGAAAELFSDLLAFHVKKSQREKAERGLPIGPVPFGYRTNGASEVPQVVTDEAEAIKRVFEQKIKRESNGAIATYLNSNFKTRKGGMFTAHTVRDMLNSRFYLGKVVYNEEEIQGQHESIITEEVFQRVQSQKITGKSIRRVLGPKGILQGRISCGNCGYGIQSDRHRYGGPMYRERHSHDCATNQRSIMAERVDAQIEAILTSMHLLPEWRAEMSRLLVAQTEGPSPQELLEKKRRIARAYGDGAYTLSEYQVRLNEIDAKLKLTTPTELPTLEEAAHLFQDIPQIWKEATIEERRQLLSPLIERVYVDMELNMIGAIVPAPGFRWLLQGAMVEAKSPAALLLSEEQTERMKVWSWWRRGRVEPYCDTYLRRPAPATELVRVGMLAA